MVGVVRAFSFLAATIVLAAGQTPKPSAWPFPTSRYNDASPSSSLPSAATPAPRDVPLQERTWSALSDQQLDALGQKALAIKPEQWRHGETPDFIIHYRRVHDALEVAREIEFDLWNVAQTLGAAPAQYQRKSHVFVFKDEDEWKEFLAQTLNPAWAHSFAHGDELFLDVHQQTGAFDSQNLAHETTHAVVARIYGARHWPLWLSEGFAEYMGEASVAARHSQNLHRQQQILTRAEMNVAELLTVNRYPADRMEVHRLYASGSKLVRYLLNRYPKEQFVKFLDRLISGETASNALVAIYGNEFADLNAFDKKFERFTR
jgi:hypothetical protein